jgi:hypothetical protein
MTLVGKIDLGAAVDNNELRLLKQALVDLQDRVRELEHIIFIDDDLDDEAAIEPLEAGHQRFVQSIRVHREGNA